MKYFPNLLSIRSLIYLIVVLSMNGCKRAGLELESQSATIEIKNNTDESGNAKDIEIKNNPCNTIVVFLGNPGVGKSALCNSIFQKNIFKSDSRPAGVTKEIQECIIGDIKYIDTPGLEDVVSKEKAAKEIEKALKENNNYKVIFVATLEGGRIRASDFATINAVCEAIRGTDFEYGIIFNKVTKKGKLNYINQNREEFNNILNLLHKRPNSELILFIEQDADMLDEPDRYFPRESENYTDLLRYVNKLKATKIHPDNVREIDIDSYEREVEGLRHQIKKIQEEYSKKTKELEEHHLTEVSSIKGEMQNQISSLKAAYDQAFREIKESGSLESKEIESVQSALDKRIKELEETFNAKLEEIAKEYQAKVAETKHECNKNVLITIKEAIMRLGAGAIGAAGAAILNNEAIQDILRSVIRQIAPALAEAAGKVTLELIKQVIGA